MKEIVLIIVVGGCCLAAPFYPRVGLLSYIWFGLMRPDLLAWSRNIPYSWVLAATTLLGSLHYVQNTPIWFRNPVVRGLLLLMIPIGLSAYFAVRPELSTDSLIEYYCMILMTLLIPLLMQEERELRCVFLIMAFSVGFVGFKYGAWGLAMGGTRFFSGFGGFMSDNNTMAAGLVMVLPLCWYARTLVSALWAKSMFLIMCFSTISAIIMTHSRGGALALAAVLFVMAVRSKRKMLAMICLALSILPSVYLVRDSYLARLETLEDPEEETSALARILYARAAVRMWKDYPLLGVGFGTNNQMALWDQYSDQASVSVPQVVHNTYLQMLVDSGAPALLIYTTLFFGTIIWLGVNVRKTRKTHPGLEVYPMALQTALIGFAVASTFLSQVRFDFLYMLLMSAAAWMEVQKKLAPAPEETPEGLPEPQHLQLTRSRQPSIAP
jgi:probable O-glycosylation ligase (exosortase A-associated)